MPRNAEALGSTGRARHGGVSQPNVPGCLSVPPQLAHAKTPDPYSASSDGMTGGAFPGLSPLTASCLTCSRVSEDPQLARVRLGLDHGHARRTDDDVIDVGRGARDPEPGLHQMGATTGRPRAAAARAPMRRRRPRSSSLLSNGSGPAACHVAPAAWRCRYGAWISCHAGSRQAARWCRFRTRMAR
jgi:hypothetical protein